MFLSELFEKQFEKAIEVEVERRLKKDFFISEKFFDILENESKKDFPKLLADLEVAGRGSGFLSVRVVSHIYPVSKTFNIEKLLNENIDDYKKKHFDEDMPKAKLEDILQRLDAMSLKVRAAIGKK